jgi:hypothetical protein
MNAIIMSSILAFLQNNAGGNILLTTENDARCRQNERMVMANDARNGNTSFGCWRGVGPMILVRWHDGTTSSWHENSFTLTDYGRSLLEQREVVPGIERDPDKENSL